MICTSCHQLSKVQSLVNSRQICLICVTLGKEFTCFELTETMRQQGDSVFISLLNNIRIGKVSPDDINLLKSCKLDKGMYPSDAIYIFAENKLKDEVNDIKLRELQHVEIIIPAIDKNFRVQSQTCGLAKFLKIKINAKVMLTVNVDIEDRLINGQLGTVFHLKYNLQHMVHIIYIKFTDSNAGLRKMQQDHYARQNNVVPIEMVEGNIPLTVGSSSPSIIRTQFPLMLAWACTVHKVQGLTLPNAVVSFELNRQKRFSHGQLYVALSRVCNLSNLFIEGNIDEKAVSADPAVSAEYERLQIETTFKTNSPLMPPFF